MEDPKKYTVVMVPNVLAVLMAIALGSWAMEGVLHLLTDLLDFYLQHVHGIGSEANV